MQIVNYIGSNMEGTALNYLLKTTVIGLVFGTFGTTLGGIIGVTFKRNSNRFLSFILEFAAGLMMAIICFDLIPESLELTNIIVTLVGIFLGIFVMFICDNTIKKVNLKNKSSLLKTGLIIGMGLALHNFPEGLAIGSGFEASLKLGYSLAIAILLHDIPEGISMSVPMKSGGMKKNKVLLYTFLSGVTTGIGAFFGALVGNISTGTIGICLAFAAGAMLYIVSGELIPESNKIYKGRMGFVGNILGFLLGIIAFNI